MAIRSRWQRSVVVLGASLAPVVAVACSSGGPKGGTGGSIPTEDGGHDDRSDESVAEGQAPDGGPTSDAAAEGGVTDGGPSDAAPEGGVADGAPSDAAQEGGNATDGGPNDGGSANSCPLAARQSQPTVVLGNLTAFAAVTDGANFYLADPGTAANAYQDGKVLYVPVTGGTPTVLVDHTTWPGTLATDGVNVYWGDIGGNIKRCATTGCGNAPTTMTTLQPNPHGMITDGVNVYWESNNGILECPVTGCGAGPTLLTSDTNALFTTNGQTLFVANNAQIGACGVTGCNGTPTTIALSPFPVVSTMVATSSELRWFAGGSANPTVLFGCSPGACASTQSILTHTNSFAYGLALDVSTTDALWSSSGGGVVAYTNMSFVWRCSLAGCDGSPTEVAVSPQALSPGKSVSFNPGTPPVVKGQKIYWLRAMTDQGTSFLNDGAIMSCPVCGCNGAPRELVQGTGPNQPVSPLNLAVSGDHAVWFDGAGNLFACSISHCNATATAIAQGLPIDKPGPSVQLATDGATAYWLSPTPLPDGGWGDAAPEGVMTLYSCPISGCGSSPNVLAGDLAPPATGIAADANYIYWVSLGLPDYLDGGSSGDGVIRFPKAGGTAEILAAGNLGGPPAGFGSAGADGAVALDAQYVYWANTYTGTIQRVPLAGGAVTTLATGQGGAHSVATDPGGVYWYQTNGFTSLPAGQTNTIQLAGGVGSAVPFSVFGGYLYWFAPSPNTLGSLQRVPTVGGSVETIATNQTVVDIAVAPGVVLYTSQTGGLMGLDL